MKRRVAVLNRGEAALRFLNSARLLSPEITPVLFISDADLDGYTARLYPERWHLGAGAEAYRDFSRIVRGLREKRCDALWPGWGFASEDPALASAVEDAGFIFVGPKPESLALLGDKVAARALAAALMIPMIPGVEVDPREIEQSIERASKISYPLLLKDPLGGGGRGISLIKEISALRRALESAPPRPHLLERQLERARHVEVQLIGDGCGGVTLFGTRDCSVQRRRQKIIEEAPAPQLGVAEAKLLDYGRQIAEALQYRGAGTVEFLVSEDGDEVYFLEVNPRLQVEHPVSEEVFGVDLIEAQLQVAFEAKLPPAREASGHAIEVRLYAEEPSEDFRPAPGRLLRLRAAQGPGIRADLGFEEGDQIPLDFDPMIGKLIAWGRDREQARRRLHSALQQTRLLIEGGASNLELLRELLDDQRFRDAQWRISDRPTPSPQSRERLQVARLAQALDSFLLSGDQSQLIERHISLGGLSVYRFGEDHFLVETEGRKERLTLSYASRDIYRATLQVGERAFEVERVPGAHRYLVDGHLYLLKMQQGRMVNAPSAGVILQLHIHSGQLLAIGDRLFTLEVMKMELEVCTPRAGRVGQLRVRAGQRVRFGQPLVELEGETPTAGGDESIAFDLLSSESISPRLGECLKAMIYGWDLPESLQRNLEETLREREESSTLQAGELSQEELISFFEDFLTLAALFERRPEQLRDEGGLWGPGVLFEAAELGQAEELPPRWRAQLLRALHWHGIEALTPSSTLSAALLRLQRAGERLSALSALTLSLLRGEPDALPLPLLDRLSQLDPERFWKLIEEAEGRRFSQLHLKTTPDSDVSPAVELERYARFALRSLDAPAGVRLYLLTARENEQDQRLVAHASITSLRRRAGRPLCLPEVERVFYQSLRALQRAKRQLDPEGARLHWNRIVFHVQPEVKLSMKVVGHYIRSLAPAARWAGLEKIVVQACFLSHDQQRQWVDISVHNFAGLQAQLSIRPSSTQPMQPRSRFESELVNARRRGRLHPMEVVNLLEGVGALPSGIFRPLRLTRGVLVEGEIGEGGQREEDVGLQLGLIKTRLRRPRQEVERVLIISDPTRRFGALTAAECDRVIAAIELAERRALPLEWVSISAGARIDFKSGTENLDACAAVLRRLILFTEAGGEVNLIVAGACVGAQAYWNAEATMMSHCRGLLIMLDQGSMVLTGRRALELSGCASAKDELELGGYSAVMGPNGEAQQSAPDLTGAYQLLYQHYALNLNARLSTQDPVTRELCLSPYPKRLSHGFSKVGELFSANPERKRPFSIRPVMSALFDQDWAPLERWPAWSGAEGVVTQQARLGGFPVLCIGIDNQQRARLTTPKEGAPARWVGGTLYPQGSRKLARALHLARGRWPVVILANLSGFDGSPESLKERQLELGAEIGRQVVAFDLPIFLVILTRYHGGAYVVFSKALNPKLEAIAIEGSYASVIGGVPAASIVFSRELRAETARLGGGVEAEQRALEGLAARFEKTHTVERAREVGSVDQIIQPASLRPYLIRRLEATCRERFPTLVSRRRGSRAHFLPKSDSKADS
ncbi:MAG: carboxyl transferase domain-containing protein [Myxococcota bacterium]|nr:carboxyl transferase domain-containing protein [Myxococcota bacterium]